MYSTSQHKATLSDHKHVYFCYLKTKQKAIPIISATLYLGISNTVTVSFRHFTNMTGEKYVQGACVYMHAYTTCPRHASMHVTLCVCVCVCMHVCVHTCVCYIQYLFHPHVTAVAHKRSQSFCQKCRWQVTAKHALIYIPYACDFA